MILALVTILAFISCSKDSGVTTTLDNNVSSGNDPNFKIVSHSDEGLSNFNRKVEVFGIDIYAANAVENNKLLHAANVMAQYLDNDEDGTVDNQLVLDKMLENKAFMVMWKTEDDLSFDPPNDRLGQDLGNDETVPMWYSDRSQRFDASLEEVLHIITHSGYAQAYPEVFGEYEGTLLSNTMDIARGGRFTSIPNQYPDGAWYTYDDATCDYSCMATEYIYWALTSILGAQENRLDEIQHEWKLNTKTKVKNQDMGAYGLLTDSQYKFPKVLPDGTYMQ